MRRRAHLTSPASDARGGRAAAYVRMSTAGQTNSLAHQLAALAQYALEQGYEIVRVYEDAAVSGVDVRKRTAFQDLMATVLGGTADFEVILVYDISRWGRFQDPDEAAHYEFLCGQEGVRIAYCAEAFGETRSAPDALLKSLKRAMAAEYSRELSAKVAAAQARLAAKGYWQNGDPGYGLRRQLIHADGTRGRVLQAGERRNAANCHTVLTLGPRSEVALIRRMHQLCGDQGKRPGEIARIFNAAAIPSPRGLAWSPQLIRKMLSDPKYAGRLVVRRLHAPLGGKRRLRPTEDWICAPSSAPAIVSPQAFAASQAVLKVEPAPDDETLLETLKPIAQAHGAVGEERLKALGVKNPGIYRRRFGSLAQAFALVDRPSPRHPRRDWDDAALLQGLARLFKDQGRITYRLVEASPDLPSAGVYDRRFGSLKAACARIGYVPITTSETNSPLGRARLAARNARISAIASSLASTQ